MSISREFLVPYLQDICSLHLTIDMLENSIEKVRSDIEELEESVEVPIPNFEERQKSEMCGIGLFVGGIEIVCGLLLKGLNLLAYVGFSDFIANFALIFGFIFALPAGLYMLVENETNKEIEKRNIEKHAQYMIDLEKAEKQIAPERAHLEEAISFLENEINKMQQILNKAYAANVIPNYYRDMYCAVYLYDWFRSGQSSDIDRALSMYVLEEIKARLDQIIINQQTMLVNQRIMIANQYKTLEQQKQHARALESKLDGIIENNEERNMYLRMIQANTETTAYFAAMRYRIQ